jgi:hypothetical protein
MHTAHAGSRRRRRAIAAAPFTLQALNNDGCYHLQLGSSATSCVVDPWLFGKEVDIASWFNTAEHTDAVVHPSAVPPHDLVIISQPFSDHCHPPTLKELARLSPSTTFAAVPEAVAAVRAAVGSASQVRVLPHAHPCIGPLCVGDLRVWMLTPTRRVMVRSNAVIVADASGRAAVHAPHGFSADRVRKALAWLRLTAVVVATSRNTYRLPIFLGGLIMPGERAADALLVACPGAVGLRIHDERKRSTGLVARLASVEVAGDGPSWLVAPVGTFVQGSSESAPQAQA